MIAEQNTMRAVLALGLLTTFVRFCQWRAIAKARTTAWLQQPTADIEDNINQGLAASVAADIMALRGGIPIRVNGEVGAIELLAGASRPTPTSRTLLRRR
jgi:Haem-degrading